MVDKVVVTDYDDDEQNSDNVYLHVSEEDFIGWVNTFPNADASGQGKPPPKKPKKRWTLHRGNGKGRKPI